VVNPLNKHCYFNPDANPTMMLPEPPKDAFELPFEVIREGWSIYKTKGDALVRLKHILLKLLVMGITEDGVAQIAMGSNVIVASTVPASMKGSPSSQAYTLEQIAKAITEPDLPFETVKEEWNEYNASGTKVSIKVVATAISKTSLIDQTGDPIYYVNYQSLFKSFSTPQDREKFLKLKRERNLPSPTTFAPAKAP